MRSPGSYSRRPRSKSIWDSCGASSPTSSLDKDSSRRFCTVGRGLCIGCLKRRGTAWVSSYRRPRAETVENSTLKLGEMPEPRKNSAKRRKPVLFLALADVAQATLQYLR